jgi:hypothetical protein
MCDLLRLVSHESAHAVVAVLLGLTVRQVRIDIDVGGVGNVTPDLDRLDCHLSSVLAGPIYGGRPLRWKPQVGVRRDEHAAAVLVERLAIDEAAWTRSTPAWWRC